MTATVELSPPRPRLLVAAAVVPLVALGVVLTAVLFLVAGIWGLLAGLIITAGVVALRARALTTGIRQRVLASLDRGRPTPPPSPASSTSPTGCPPPAACPSPLFVLDDPGANMLVVGEASATPALVVTSGLLAAVDRIQLEAVVAWAFAELRQGELPAASVAVTTVARSAITLAGGGPGALSPCGRSADSSPPATPYVADPVRDLLLDQAAASLTRYPAGPAAAPSTGSPRSAPPSPGPARRRTSGWPTPAWPCRACRPGPGSSCRVEALRLL